MDISRADGSVIIVADVNSSPAEKKLIQLEKTIEETAAKLDSKQKEKTGIEERLNTAKASALATEEAVSKLRAEIARLNDREWIARTGLYPAGLPGQSAGPNGASGSGAEGTGNDPESAE